MMKRGKKKIKKLWIIKIYKKKTGNEIKIKNENDINRINKGVRNQNVNDDELFREKSREKVITELFLQNYIINNSDILIVVVGLLSFSEQKLLNRIKRELKRAKLNKTLYVIHNLMTYTSVKQVENYIKDTLLKCATFELEKQIKINTKIETESNNGIVFYEKNTNPKIFHLVFANEGSDAGNYYNKYTLEFLENSYEKITDLKGFNIIRYIKRKI